MNGMLPDEDSRPARLAHLRNLSLAFLGPVAIDVMAALAAWSIATDSEVLLWAAYATAIGGILTHMLVVAILTVRIQNLCKDRWCPDTRYEMLKLTGISYPVTFSLAMLFMALSAAFDLARVVLVMVLLDVAMVAAFLMNLKELRPWRGGRKRTFPVEIREMMTRIEHHWVGEAVLLKTASHPLTKRPVRTRYRLRDGPIELWRCDRGRRTWIRLGPRKDWISIADDLEALAMTSPKPA